MTGVQTCALPISLQPGQDPGPPSLRGPLSPSLVRGPGMRPGPAHREAGPPTRRDWPHWAVPGAHWLPRLPVPRRRPAPAPAHSCGATWPPAPPPSTQSAASLRPRRLGAPAGPLDPCLFPTEPSGCSLVGRGAPGRTPPDPQTPISSPGSPRAARAWAESAGQITTLDLPTPLAVPRAPTPSLRSLALPAGAFLAPQKVSCPEARQVFGVWKCNDFTHCGDNF